MAVVVRCPGCRGAAQVGPEAVGLLVVCPRCNDPFLAVEDTTPTSPPAPLPGRNPASPARSPRPRWRAEPVAPPEPRRRTRRAPRSEPAADPHDHPTPAGGLPLSVMIGLALLPFAIPLLWLVAPLVVGQEPMLSVAAPAALAVSASVLCLAVVGTVDWTPATRLKGVLMMVGLAYFAGLSLYFLKEKMAVRAQEWFGTGQEWHDVYPDDRTYQAKLPGEPGPPTVEQPLRGVSLKCYTASRKQFTQTFVCVVGSGQDNQPGKGNGDDWFDAVTTDLVAASGGTLRGQPRKVRHLDQYPGREWVIQLPNRKSAVRVVRVYRAGGRVYYLAAEGPHVDHHDIAREFFDSFMVTARKD